MNLQDFKNKRILITGGVGFIGGCLVNRFLKDNEIRVFNLDKLNYASNLHLLNIFNQSENHTHLKIDLINKKEVEEAVNFVNPDYIFHLAAESHVDRSIENPENFINSNILGTFNLLEATRLNWESLKSNRKKNIRFIHISTDEVFGSLGNEGYFSEDSPYNPRSPYSASKASSDHLVKTWHHTYNLPTIVTNCSNNFGPWQFPEKLIPLVIFKSINDQIIPLYGDGENIRDWLFVEDHIEGIIQIALKGKLGETYCIGGNEEKSNIEIVKEICNLIDELKPRSSSSQNLIKYVHDRPGHDKRYAINSSKIRNKLGWEPKYKFDNALRLTVSWYLKNISWCENLMRISNYNAERIGLKSLKQN